MKPNQAHLAATIDREIASLSKPGVLTVRPGYKVTNDWLTDQPAIVVTVKQKTADVPAAEAIPATVGGIPTDVRQASPIKAHAIEDPQGYARELRLAPDSGSVPHFEAERTPAGDHPAAAASAHALAAAASTRTKLQYSGPDGYSLDPIEAEMTIHLSASPDAGWPVLEAFLLGVQQSLTVGMYDFTSAHVLAGVQTDLKDKQLDLVLDHPALNPHADQTDADTVAALTNALGGSVTQAWALTRFDPDVTAWIYPTSYHIKVAVRDSATTWLSSGNWNNSNQPDIQPVVGNPDADAARHCDRDWHVIIENQSIAETFEAYIRNDLAVAAAHGDPPEDPGLCLPAPPLGVTETRPFAQFWAPTSVTANMRIVPLLTPDQGVYVNAIRDLIDSAQSTLYMQFQYIELPKITDATSRAFVSLVQAVIDRQKGGVDVRIIVGQSDSAGYLEQLQALGLDVVNGVRVQCNVHNKGMIVDSSAVLISSQNWSTDGTLYNRDAGVIVYNNSAAEYFEQIFMHDWTNLAAKKAASD
jgi:phosphatidylserine/phosphatidylglycerophosphate/cardiolipin synthase-like enzyme